MKFERLKVEPEKENVIMSAVYTILSLWLLGIGVVNYKDNSPIAYYISIMAMFLVGYNFRSLLVNAKKYKEDAGNK